MRDLSLTKPMQFLRRQADIVLALGVLMGACSGIIYVFGGSIPPWQTAAQAAEDKRQSASIQNQTVAALARLSGKYDRLQHHVEEGDCAALDRTYGAAKSTLDKNPFDQMALALVYNLRAQMRQIPNCGP